MAYYNVDTLLTEIQRNALQRSSQFRCRIPVGLIGQRLDTNLAYRYPIAAQLLEKGLLCQQTRTPSRQFETTPLSIYGYEEKFPIFTTFTDMECSFLLPMTQDITGQNTSLEIVELFHAWQNLIQPIASRDPNTNTTVRGDMVLSFPEEYRLKDGMTLEQFDPYNSKRNTGQVAINASIGRIQGRVAFGDAAPDTESNPTMVYRFRNVYPITVESSQVSWASIDEYQTLTVTFAYSYWTSDNSALYG